MATVLNENIRQLRILNGFSQVELAKRLSVSKQCVSNWENDNIQPSVDMLVKIARYFNVSADYLLDLSEGKYIDVSDLDDDAVAHIRMIIDDIRGRK